MSGAGPRPRAEPFYNPAMALDRDLAVALVRALDPPPQTGWETNAATGVRGLRLVREAGTFRRFLLTEASPRSVVVLRRNAEAVPGAEAVLGDGTLVPASAPFDYVDVDPYGSPLGYLPSAIAATRNGGVLAVTATDLMVLAGAQPAACRRLYGANPVRGRLGPEGGLRILIAAIAARANEAGRDVSLLLGYVGGHHVRAYVRLDPGPGQPLPIAAIDPATWGGPPIDGPGPFGPMWLGPLVEPNLAGRLHVPAGAAEPIRLERLIGALRSDARVPAPFYFEPNELAHALGLARPPPIDRLLAALEDGGDPAGRTHVRPGGVRTAAPPAAVEAAARRVFASR